MSKRIILIAGIMLAGMALLGTCAVMATPQFWTRLAKQRLNNGDWTGAAKLADVALRRNSNYPPAHMTRAIALHRLGDHEESLKSANTAIRRAPEMHLAYVIRAGALLALGDFEKALPDARHGVEHLPQSELSWVTQGQALTLNGDYDQAIAAFDQAISLNARSAVAHASSAIAELCKGSQSKAMNHAMLAIDIDDKNPETFVLRGWIYLLAGETQLALSDLLFAADEMPDNREAQLALGTAWLLGGKMVEARERLSRALDLEIPPGELKIIESSPSARVMEELAFNKTGLSHYRAHFNMAILDLMAGRRDSGLKHLAEAKVAPPPPIPFSPAEALEKMAAENPNLTFRVSKGKVVWITDN